MKTEQQVLSYAPSSNKPGAWLKLKVIDDKGKERDAYIKNEALYPLIKQPGVYEFEKTKNGEYWDITGVRFVRPLNANGGSSTGAAPSATPTAQRGSGGADVNVIIQNRAITAQVCVKAAVELMGVALTQGAFKSGEGLIDTADLMGDTTTLLNALLDKAGEFVKGKTDEPKKEGTRVEGERTYEKVPEGA